MNEDDYVAEKPGDLVPATYQGKRGKAFVPTDLPPEIIFDSEIAAASERAGVALGNLNGAGRILPDPTLLLRPFMSREALASSRIEGTRAEYGQLLLLEAADKDAITDPDYQEVSNYIEALYYGWHKPEDRPVSISLLLEIHGILLRGVRGANKGPGQLREQQVLIGSSLDNINSARFVPPPPEFVRDLLEHLCLFIEQPSELPALVRIALIHYQLEAIHPFQDGNGRLGRVVLPMILGWWQMLDLPLLYLSEFFEDHRDEYVDRMLAVSQKAAWREWILFTLKAVEDQSNDALLRVQRLLELREEMRIQYQSSRMTAILPIIDVLFNGPAITIPRAAEIANVTYRTASKAVDQLVTDGVLRPTEVRRRNRIFVADSIIGAIMNLPTE